MSRICQENVYGHAKRLDWILSYLSKDRTVFEFGCGTGYMISFPLAKLGLKIYGFDLDESSINFGRKIFQQAGIPPETIMKKDMAEFNVTPDAVIASEVFEHIESGSLDESLELIKNKLKPNGVLLVTVPNGYGWFEMESFLWYRVGLGKLLEKLKIISFILKIKYLFLKGPAQDDTPSTLAASPHVQRFTFNSIQRLLRNNEFKIREITGSVLFAGPFTNLVFGGFELFMKLNNKLGSLFPRIASGFFVSCER